MRCRSTWFRPRVRYRRRIGYRHGLAGSGVPWGADLFLDRSGQSRIDDGQTDGPVRTWSVADITLPGVMRGSDLRFRSFYLQRRGRGALTVAAQTQEEPTVPTGLRTGAVVQRSMVGAMGLQVPEVLGVGQVNDSSDGSVVDFVVERMGDGRAVDVGDVVELVAVVLEALPSMWAVHLVRYRGLSGTERRRLAEMLPRLVNEGEGMSLWPRRVDRVALGRRMDELLDRDLELTTGVSYGDLGIGNLLRLPSGDLALIDREHAGHRLLSHDVLKLLLSAPIRPHAWVDLQPDLPAAGPSVASAQEQVAVAAMLFFGGLAPQHCAGRAAWQCPAQPAAEPLPHPGTGCAPGPAD